MPNNHINHKINLISLKLTNRCNLNCKMCWQKKEKNNPLKKLIDLAFDDFLIIINKLNSLSPNNIYLWGGEPLLHPRIIDIIREIKINKFLAHLITNGLLLNNFADELIAVKLDTISISIDGIAKIHDSIRGLNGAYDTIITGLKKLLAKKKLRPITAINTVITPENYLHLYEMIEELSALKVNGLQLQFPVFFDLKSGQDSETYLEKELNIKMCSWHGFVKSYDSIDYKKLEEILSKIQKNFPKVGFYPSKECIASWFNKNRNSPIKCLVPWQRVNVEPNGDMNICTDFCDMVAGNLLKQSFDSIWNNNIYQKFRDHISNNNYMPICKHCTYAHLPWSNKNE